MPKRVKSEPSKNSAAKCLEFKPAVQSTVQTSPDPSQDQNPSSTKKIIAGPPPVRYTPGPGSEVVPDIACSTDDSSACRAQTEDDILPGVDAFLRAFAGWVIEEAQRDSNGQEPLNNALPNSENRGSGA